MGDTTKIGWTNAPGLAPGKTWNPWQGCTMVSQECRFCYMFRDKIRYGQNPRRVVQSKPPTFNAPLKWKEPCLCFTCSWSDFFHADADPWRDAAWNIIRSTPHVTYLILTKRPHLIADRLPGHSSHEGRSRLPADWYGGYPNVWLGISAGDDHWLRERLADLQRVPAVRKFASLEPLLGPIVIPERSGLDWVIVGGESGPEHRPMDPEWVRSIRDQCTQRSNKTWFPRPIPFFFKQWGGLHHDSGGRELDGREWSEWPPIRGQGRIAA